MNNVPDTRCKFSHRCRKLWKRRKGKGYMDRGRIRDELRKESLLVIQDTGMNREMEM